MADGQLPPSDAVSPGRVVACFLCATFAPLPPRWKQGRLQLDADGIRWGPGLRRRETGLLLPNPLRVQVVRDVRGWERLHIKANAFQIVEVATDQGQIRLAVSRESVSAVVDHMRATEQHP
jgi:hypothetical protein